MSYNPFSLDGMRILITGAASGIGKRTAIECSKLGASVILVDINEEKLQEVKSELENSERHACYSLDLTNDAEIENMVKSIEPIDGLVNNAGIGGKNLLVRFLKKEDLEKIVEINAYAGITLTRLLVKNKKINKGGSIVYTASIAGYTISNPGNTLYAISKNIINTYASGAALELAGMGIRCNTVNPGSVNTPLIARSAISAEDRERDKAQYPLKRYGEPEDIAFPIIFLLSKGASWITGSHLIVDGGRSLI